MHRGGDATLLFVSSEATLSYNSPRNYGSKFSSGNETEIQIPTILISNSIAPFIYV
jgi:hypothetical protein